MGGHHRSRSAQSPTPTYSSYRRSSISSSALGYDPVYEVPKKSHHKSKRRQVSLPDVLKYRIPGAEGQVWTNLGSWTDGRVHAVDFGKKEKTKHKGCKCSSSSSSSSKHTRSSRPTPTIEHRGHRRRATVDDLSLDFDRSLDLSSSSSSSISGSMGTRSPIHRYASPGPIHYAPSPPVSYGAPSTASYPTAPSVSSYQSPRVWSPPSSRSSRSMSSPEPYIPYSQAPSAPRSYVSTASWESDGYPSSSWTPPSIRSYATPPSTVSSSRRSSSSRTPSLSKSYTSSTASSTTRDHCPSSSQPSSPPKPYLPPPRTMSDLDPFDQPPPPYSQLSSRRGSFDSSIDGGLDGYFKDEESKSTKETKDPIYIGPWDWPEGDVYERPEVAEYPYDGELVRDMEARTTPSKYSRSRGGPIVYIHP